MRKSDVMAAIKAVGMVARYDAAYQEWKIDYRRTDPRWTEDTAYYTTYVDDAVETAKVMAAYRP